MNYTSLNGKVAIVTGGAVGIGAATAKKLANSGVILSLIDINEEGLKNVAKECETLSAKYKIPKPYIFVGDLTDDATRSKFVDQTINQFGRLDILVNNAGIASPSSIFDTTMENADKLFSTLLRAPYDMCRLTCKHLIKTKGCIVNLASVCGHFILLRNPGYDTSKAAILHLTKCFADELAEYNVRVNSISPGIIKTHILTPYSPPSDKHVMAEAGKEFSAFKRAGEPEDIAKTVAFLASDESSYMTGSDIVVDGGCICMNRCKIYK